MDKINSLLWCQACLDCPGRFQMLATLQAWLRKGRVIHRNACHELRGPPQSNAQTFGGLFTAISYATDILKVTRHSNKEVRNF